MPVAIGIRGVSKVFGAGPGAAVALEGVSFDVQPGELFFLLGPSGCGKTTLLRILAGFVEPTAGRILFDDRDVTDVPANRRNTGMVFQSYALWPHMTVAANVEFGLSVRGVPTLERERRVADALAAVHMGEYALRRPAELSGGQQQRVALARALVVRPDVLLLDEPLSNLDARLRAALRTEVRRICKHAGITTVYVTHDQKEALAMCDRLAVLDRGRLIQIGAPDEVYRRPATRFVAEFLGDTNFIPGRIVASAGAGVIVETPLGRLLAEAPPPPPAGSGNTPQGFGGVGPEGRVPAEVICSIRPESWQPIGSDRPANPPARDDRPTTEGCNVICGVVREATYLGEVAHLLVEMPGPTLVRVATLNPRRARLSAPAPGVFAVAPEDVVLLPANP